MPDNAGLAAPLIAASGLTVRRGGKTILHDIDLAVRPGEIVTVIGPNGSGKTTLVRAMLGLMPPTTGTASRRSNIAIGYVPQQLVVDRSLPLTVSRFLRLAGWASRERVAAALDETGAGYLIDCQMHELSGGEVKRAVLARALLHDPALLVLDEPTAHLDITGQSEFYELIRRLRETRHCGVLLVSHDLHLVMAATDTVVCLNGHICCSGAPGPISRDPAFLAMFGRELDGTLALYPHHHDHRHALTGEEDAVPATEPHDG